MAKLQRHNSTGAAHDTLPCAVAGGRKPERTAIVAFVTLAPGETGGAVMPLRVRARPAEKD